MGRKVTHVSTYTTDIAREEWHTMKIYDFLRKYEVCSAFAYKALGPRAHHKCRQWNEGLAQVEEIGKDDIAKMVEKMGISHTARHFSIGIRVIRTHILGIKRGTPSVKKWKQPGVGLI